MTQTHKVATCSWESSAILIPDQTLTHANLKKSAGMSKVSCTEFPIFTLTQTAERLSHATHSSGGAVKPCRWMDTLPGPLVLYPLRDVMQQPLQAEHGAITAVVLGSALLVALHGWACLR